MRELELGETDTPTGHCTYCPRLCRYACPVETASGREALTPKAKMQTAGELSRQSVPLSAEDLEVLWGCSACGACEDACLHSNPVGQTLYAARAEAASAGSSPVVVQQAAKRFLAHGNPFGVSLTETQMLIAGERPRRATHSAPVLLLGCHALFSDQPLAHLALELARRVRPDVQLVLSTDPNGSQTICCGRTLSEAGERRSLEHHRLRMIDALRDTTEWWVLETTCLDDFITLSELHPNKPRVLSLAEVIAASDLKPKQRARSITLHSGCGVRRNVKAEEALVALAQRCSDDVRVPPANMQFSGCCGGRGMIDVVMPDVAKDMARGRRAELEEMKAEKTVHFSSCCGGQIGDAATHLLRLFG